MAQWEVWTLLTRQNCLRGWRTVWLWIKVTLTRSSVIMSYMPTHLTLRFIKIKSYHVLHSFFPDLLHLHGDGSSAKTVQPRLHCPTPNSSKYEGCFVRGGWLKGQQDASHKSCRVKIKGQFLCLPSKVLKYWVQNLSHPHTQSSKVPATNAVGIKFLYLPHP